MLVIILIAAEVFTNALEHLGEKLGISEGVTGSIFAAVGTAMPETMVPLLAIFAGTSTPSTETTNSSPSFRPSASPARISTETSDGPV